MKGNQTPMSAITPLDVIHLQSIPIECRVCQRPWSYSPEGPSFGVPMYEDEILPDDDPGEWGGMPTCPRCYFVVRGLLADLAANGQTRRLSISEVRRVCL